MSEVVKSKRKPSKLDALDLAYTLRQQMTAEILATFALSQKRLDQHLNAITKGMGSWQERDDLKKTITELELDKQVFIIKEERQELLRLSRLVPQYLRMANTIYPLYYNEWQERRKLFDLAMANCNAIQDELNYIAQNVLGDRNKYCQIVKGYEKCYNLIRRLRQSDNRVLPKIAENEAKLKSGTK